MTPLNKGLFTFASYNAGPGRVAQLRREYPAEKIIPALYGCSGLVDILTIDDVLVVPEI